MVKEMVMWLENADFDYSNGNTCNGVDEGNVLGWNAHSKIVNKAKALMETIAGK